jgi:hypothetical protein
MIIALPRDSSKGATLSSTVTRRDGSHALAVMAGLVPAIHVFRAQRKQDVDARPKAGHDDVR